MRDTIASFKEILDGKVDNLPEQAFFYVGRIDEVKEAAEKLGAPSKRMANAIPFKLITPTKVVFEGDAELVIAVTTEGEEGILPHHAPFLAGLQAGRAARERRQRRRSVASGDCDGRGFMQALPDRVTVLVDEALAVRRHRRRQDARRTRGGDRRARKPPAAIRGLSRASSAVIDFANAKLRLTGTIKKRISAPAPSAECTAQPCSIALETRCASAAARGLEGSVATHGAKNAALPIMAAALLAKGTVTLHRVPRITDVSVMWSLLEALGARIRYEGDNTVTIDASNVASYRAPYTLVRKLAASFDIVGPLLGRFGRAEVPLPGGCVLGTRATDMHEQAFRRAWDATFATRTAI